MAGRSTNARQVRSVSLVDFRNRRPVLSSALLWALAIVLTLACLSYQDQTGPTYPLEGDFDTAHGSVRFKILRSETIGSDLAVMLLEPVPDGVSGLVQYRRLKSDDEWAEMPMERGEFHYARRGRKGSDRGLGAMLPSLDKRAGKYELFVFVDDGEGEPVSITGSDPIFARYKGDVPRLPLLVHIVVVFLSMALAVRTVLEVLAGGRFKSLLWWTIGSLLLGAFVLGPLVQWYAFRVLWAGFPFGYDWTDNKVLLELAFWLVAAYLNRGDRRNPVSIYVAGLVTLAAYFVPHSVFGSEYNYLTGTGHGTAG